MTILETLLKDAEEEGITIQKVTLPANTNGIYYDDGIHKPLIALNQALATQAEIACTVAEELGHYHTSCGNLLTDSRVDKIIIRKQEAKAKRWATHKLITLRRLIHAFESGAGNMLEMAEHLGVTEEFLVKSFQRYNEIYGKFKVIGRYMIYFDPPGILKALE